MKTLFFLSLLIPSSAFAGRCPDPEDFTCHIRASCPTPWGERVMNGQTVLAYQAPEASRSRGCISEVRVCEEGHLSGSFEFDSCQISDSHPHQP